MAHTPGPWKAYRHDLHADEVTSPDGDSIAEVYSTGDPADFHANTNLIAAAPDLLDAAKAILAKWDRAESFNADSDPLIDGLLRDAVAKVEGRSDG